MNNTETIKLPRTRFGFKRLLKKSELTDKKILDSVGKLKPSKRKYLFLRIMLKNNPGLSADVKEKLEKDKKFFAELESLFSPSKVSAAKAMIKAYKQLISITNEKEGLGLSYVRSTLIMDQIAKGVTVTAIGYLMINTSNIENPSTFYSVVLVSIISYAFKKLHNIARYSF